MSRNAKNDLSKPTVILSVVMAFCLLSSCGQSLRFADRPPVWRENDMSPIELPASTRYIRMDYYSRVLLRKPTTRLLTLSEKIRAKEINSLDHVPASSWYNLRLGYKNITPEELLLGPADIGPPLPPMRVVRAKHLGSSPGFIIADSRDYLYLIKMDPKYWPALETTTAFIVNRLFWGFGFNVPEDYTIFFDSEEVPVDPTADISREEVQLVFDAVAPPVNGLYRATASLLLKGQYLGPIPDTGVRKDDPNDHIPHQHRRLLRALKVFGAFTNQTDIRIDNSLDVYQGSPGEGYVKHYLVDFGGAFGGRGAKYDRLWDGYTHLFSFSTFFKNLLTLGLHVKAWENITPTPWASVGAFEAAQFQPDKWKENYPFEPIRQGLPDDHYWAAKIIAALTREHIRVLVEGAFYPEPDAERYMIETIMARRQKIIDHYFGEVTPLEWRGIEQGNIVLEDIGATLESNPEKRRYEVRICNAKGEEIANRYFLESRKGPINLSLEEALFQENGHYLRFQVWLWRGEKRAPRAVECHVRGGDDGGFRLSGITH